METIFYNPQGLRYEVPPTMAQRKAALIQDINTIQLALTKKPIDGMQFDYLESLEIDKLTEIVNDQAELLARINRGY